MYFVSIYIYGPISSLTDCYQLVSKMFKQYICEDATKIQYYPHILQQKINLWFLNITEARLFRPAITELVLNMPIH